MATLAEFPVELYEYIILLAARACALDDKPTLAALARASRAIHAIVQPILVDTLLVTTSNLQAILAYAERRVFATTRCLVVEPVAKHGRVDGQEALCRALEDGNLILSALEMFYGPFDVLCNLAHSTIAKRVVLVPPALGGADIWIGELSQQQISHLSSMTHIHGGKDILSLLYATSEYMDLWMTESCLTHAVVVIEPTIEMFDTSRAASMISQLLSLSRLERLCVRVRQDVWVGSSLEAWVRVQKDARVWVYLVNDSDPPPYDLRMVMDSDYWLMGTPLIDKNT
ncbi:hypothetical protein EXIGLDRAFT_721113 [Exidia glandulosa HHB12029]|uniref:F-box domain-containing protein n=1 Tax=Exidia glandulosa HHB12029 TaxID=1314781 RepID=A0A165FXP6_EXIGL|nr:hypothetical protein EXIGLDRAFT_721113 [Exidia glandulosa HHB12029]